MPSFTVDGTLVFTYYRDLPKACAFYQDVLGLRLVVDQGWCKIFQIRELSFIGLVDGEHGTHRPSEAKPVIVSFITDDLDGWYAHLQAAGAAIRNPLGTSERIGVRGFMALDPEGYVLEFESFLDQPRNAEMRALLAQASAAVR